MQRVLPAWPERTLVTVLRAPLAEGIARLATEVLTYEVGLHVSPERSRAFERIAASVLLLPGGKRTLAAAGPSIYPRNSNREPGS